MLLPRKWALSLGLLAAVPGISVAGPFDIFKADPAAAESREVNQNQKVAEDIATALKRANLVHKNVTIEYKAGVAIIGGQIKDEAQKAVVTRLVSRVPSVETVQNDLVPMDVATPQEDAPIQQAAAVQQGAPNRSVQPVAFQDTKARSNQEVAQGIATALTTAGLSGYDIEIRYKSGACSLLGNVESEEQVARAQQAASSVPGVNQVLNELRVNGKKVDVARQQPPFGPRGPIQQTQASVPTQGAPQGPPPGYAPGPQGPPPGYAPGPQGPPPGYAPGPQGPPPGFAPQHVPAAQVGHQVYNQPNVPDYAWPSYAQYDNYAAIQYPSQYDASAFPYIGPYYPYPQVPLGWRSSTLEWDDGSWNLTFDSRTDRWWWFLNPKNW